MDKLIPLTESLANGDEDRAFGPAGARYIGNFHKTLPHTGSGEVCTETYEAFVGILDKLDGGEMPDFETLPHMLKIEPPMEPLFENVVRTRVAPLVNPAAGAAREKCGPDPRDLAMGPAPKVDSVGTAAEMTELYWMAVLRDLPFARWDTDPRIDQAVIELGTRFGEAIADTSDRGRLRLEIDLPKDDCGLKLTRDTLFRSGLPGEEHGPLVSQFFLHDAAFGTHRILQSQIPYRRGRNFLTSHGTWLLAQATGYDRHGRDYPNANNYSDDNAYFEPDHKRRRMRTMRDLARFVNRDALHQAYFDAALMLLAWGAPVDDGNPYKKERKRDAGFGVLGAPHLLTLVSEVASRALKVVWRQKWLVHRRLRPEAYGGLAQMQFNAPEELRRDYGLPAWVADTAAARLVAGRYGTLFLPMAYSSGSPAHPAYGAGHATVAGACITVLKAWFKEETLFASLFERSRSGGPQEPQGDVSAIVQPDEDGSDYLPEYIGDCSRMTVAGELNKLASNVAMGRSMGGVHWRSDNTRSLRLGEAVAAEIMRRQSMDYAEKGQKFTFTTFDGVCTTIEGGEVRPPLSSVVAPPL